jgi:hypothetical protein
MSDQTQQQVRKSTPEEDIRELFSRVAKLNDIASALLAPAWGSEVGIIPVDHPLYVGEKPTTEAATQATDLQERTRAEIESEIYEYRERTMFWPETGGVTEEIARLATRGAMKALAEHLDIGDAEAWCKTCRRVWGGKRHRCEGDAEQRLSHTRDTCQQLLAEADAFQAGHNPDCECEWGDATQAAANRILAAIDGGGPAAAAAPEATRP